jgi:hypothetical protein
MTVTFDPVRPFTSFKNKDADEIIRILFMTPIGSLEDDR